ncbi:mitofilin family membrane protein [Tropicimonas sp. IMCC6043]|uniref:mitofilin family membrane protein n=1 Tax=Tropicimonas sp. IMCC6043 TaxID=2510645 RepID=UPI00101CC1B6|nr:mitofilin family membrane protein [Tropicimonas sp. IMCC6043]RYH10003.1 hypothetical protein EU800_10670 [Tropicimonas sp. IMCC6043]
MTDKKKSDSSSEDIGRSEDETTAAAKDSETRVDADAERLAETGDVPDRIVDAEVIAEIPAEEDATQEDAAETANTAADDEFDAISDESVDDTEDAPEPGDEAETVAEAEDRAEAPEAPEESEAEQPVLAESPDEALPSTEHEAERRPEPETVVVESKSSVFPGFFGGAIAAAGLIFALPYVVPPKFLPANPALEQALNDQAGTIAALREQIGTLEGKLSEAATASALAELKTASDASLSDLSATTTQIRSALDQLSSDLSSGRAFAGVTEQLRAMAARVDELEKRPIAEATDPASAAAVEAYGREVADLRKAVEAQMAQAETLVQEATASADKAVSQALDATKDAEEKAAADAAAAAEKALRAERELALADIQTALADGSPFSDALAKLDGVEIPAPLSAAAADGVATWLELQDTFTLAAREALTASRSEMTGGSAADRAATWIQNQLGVRSLAPSEGDDPDAVLSRAEAALGEARLTDAVNELSGLPDGGRQIMADWIAKAKTRAEALAAADELAASLAKN